ncbi:MAG: metallophosphoesterase family protein [Candidatus Methanofastidiosia archaeon]
MFVHAADAHLGISRYTKIDPKTGMNIRSLDFLNSFGELCDFVVENKPEIFLFCGDLFDKVNPTNYVRRAVQKRCLQLSRSGIETFLLSGNHDTPRTKGVSNPLILYKNIPHIHVILFPWQKEIGKFSICAVPFTSHPQDYIRQPKSGRMNILMMHTTIEGARFGSERFMCFKQETLKRSEIPSYDYVALGHIHKRQTLSRNNTKIVYPGSLERYDFNEIDEKKGFYLVDGDEEFIGVKTRPMISKEIKVDGISGYEITNKCIDMLESSDIEEKIVRIELSGKLDEAERNSINFAEIKEKALLASHFSIADKTVFMDYLNVKQEKVIFHPRAELERYLKMTKRFSERLYEKGTLLIQERLGR